MSILNLSEVSRQFHVNRSTVYKAIKAGRLSRRSDGNFDLVEVIRCFGEPTGQHNSNQDTEKDSTTKATQVNIEIVALLKQQIVEYKQRENEYKDRENRLLDQIDRMQTLIEYKVPQPKETTNSTSETTQVDNEFVAHIPDKKIIKKQLEVEDYKINSNIECSSNVLPNYVGEQQQAIVEFPQIDVAQNKGKKRGLFGRIFEAVLNNK